MKKKLVFKIVITVLFSVFSFSSIKAQLFYQNSHLFVGQKPTGWSDVGNYSGVYIGPTFGIEYYGNGLNIWRPYSTTNWGNYKLFIAENGNVGIGDLPSSYKLNVFGQIRTTAAVYVASDSRLKRNITDIRNTKSTYMSKLMKLNLYMSKKQIIQRLIRRLI